MTTEDFEPRRGYYPEDSHIGLPDLDFSGYALLLAIILLTIGWLISSNSTQENGEKGSTLGGCLIMIGICCAFPAYIWIASIGSIIYIVVIAIFLLAVVISYIFKK